MAGLTGALIRSEMLIRDFQVGTYARNVEAFALVAFVELHLLNDFVQVDLRLLMITLILA